jgi:hypothetical protein
VKGYFNRAIRTADPKMDHRDLTLWSGTLVNRGGEVCSGTAAPLGLQWAHRCWPNRAHIHGSAGWWPLNQEGDLARLTRGVSASGEASQWPMAAMVLPCISDASHSVPKGSLVTKRLRAGAATPPQPPQWHQLQRNHRNLELNSVLGLRLCR